MYFQKKLEHIYSHSEIIEKKYSQLENNHELLNNL